MTAVAPTVALPAPLAPGADDLPRVPVFRRHLTPVAIPGEAVYLVSERGVSVVNGALASELAPLLDGTRNVDQIAARLAPVAPERVAHAVETLVRAGWVCMARPPGPTGPATAGSMTSAAYWEMAGVDGDTASDRLGQRVVRVTAVGDVGADAVVAGCRAAGLEARAADGVVPAAGELLVVVVDDYLHPGLAEINRACLEERVPWLLAKPGGGVIWVGPVFQPGSTGCWSCLANRLAANRQAGTYLQDRLGPSAVRPPRAELAATLQLAASLIGLEAAAFVARATAHPAVVRTIETPVLAVEHHQLVRRPQCPDCGDPGLQAERARRPVVFQSRAKAVTRDGGHRSATPEELIERFSAQVSPVTGVVTGLFRVNAGPSGLHLYTAGQNLARRVTDLRSLRRGLRSLSCGKGMSDVQARASAIGEAIERYSGVFQGDEERRQAAFAELGDDAVHPAACHLFSERQYERRAELNAAGSNFNVVFDPLPDTEAIEWSPVWSVSQGRTKWLPTSSLYYGYPQVPGRVFAVADSNGNAAGTSLEDAALQGFFELVERDAVALWWYNRLRRPALDLAGFAEPYVDELVAGYAALGRQLWALDLTTDLGVPTVGAISRRVGHPTEDILVAFGSHFDPRIALQRALTEMNQFLPAVLPTGARGAGQYSAVDGEIARWWATATVDNQPYLIPDPVAPSRGPGHWPEVANDDLAVDLDHARVIVEAIGLEMLVLDQTRPDIGLPVAKVIVPGLRHFWARLGPGRLYDVPVDLGWADRPTAEEDLNPIPVFI